MLNSIGLANPGIDRFLAEMLPRLGSLGCRSGSRSGGSPPPSTRRCAPPRRARRGGGARAEPLGPQRPGADEGAAEIVAAARPGPQAAVRKAVPALPDVAAVAVARSRPQTGSRSSTLSGAAGQATLAPMLGTATGGFGAGASARRPRGRFRRYTVAQLPIVGVGGVDRPRCTRPDRRRRRARGLGTILFPDPDAPARVGAELAAEPAADGLRGSPPRRAAPPTPAVRRSSRIEKAPAKTRKCSPWRPARC